MLHKQFQRIARDFTEKFPPNRIAPGNGGLYKVEQPILLYFQNKIAEFSASNRYDRVYLLYQKKELASRWTNGSKRRNLCGRRSTVAESKSGLRGSSMFLILRLAAARILQ